MTDLLSRIKNNRVFLKVLRHQTGGRGYHAEGHNVSHRSATLINKAEAREAGGQSHETQARMIQDDGKVIENPHPEKAAIPNRNPPRGLKRLWGMLRKRVTFVRSVIFPQKTAEQIQERRDRAIKQQIIMDANKAMSIMSNRYKELLFFQKIHEGDKTRIKPVPFDVIAYDWDKETHTGGNQIKFHFDCRPGRMPAGVYIRDLLSQPSIDELQFSMEHPVKGSGDIAGGIITLMRSGNNGLPVFISVLDAWSTMPKNLPPLAFPVGNGESAQHYYKDLDDCPHLLIIGASRQGKSNMINVILCTYLRMLSPRQVQFVLFDCKNMMEFSFYEHIPHLYIDNNRNIPGIIGELKDAIPAMRSLVEVMNKRMIVIREAGYKNMNDYNLDRRGESRMPALVVAFDDYIALSLIYGKEADDLLIILSSQARAAGMYLILGAQYPKSDRVPSMALINFMVVIAFRLKPGASRALLGDISAVDLPCRGRASFNNFDEQAEVQTPRISDSTIRAVVEHAITNKKTLISGRLDIEEILAYALEHQGGRLDVHKLFDVYRGKIGMKRLQTMLQRADEQYFNVDGTLYKVTMKYGRPRRMVLAEPLQEEQPVPIEAIRGIEVIRNE